MNTPRPARRRTARAFTLVELVVVVMILGILAGVAAPRLIGASEQAASQALLTEVQAMLRAAELYAAETGQLPLDAKRRVLPPELAGRIDADAFSRKPPIGGQYDWQGEGALFAFIGVSVQSSPSIGSFLEIDRIGDNGDLATGWIRQDGPRLDFWLEQK